MRLVWPSWVESLLRDPWGCRSCVPQRMGCDDVGPRLRDRTHLRVLLRTMQQARVLLRTLQQTRVLLRTLQQARVLLRTLQQARVLLRTLQQACHGRTSETKQPQGACAIRRAVLLRPANEAAAAPPQQTVYTLPSRRRTRRSAVQRHFQVGASSASPSTTSASADFGLVALASCSHTLGTVRT